MKPILVNEIAIARSSRGVRRYYHSVRDGMDWPAGISLMSPGRSAPYDRVREIFARGSKQSLMWSPVHRGPLFAWNHVVTVHDCINVRYAYAGRKRDLLHAVSQQLFANAVAIVAISEATATALRATYRIDPERLVVIRSSNEPLGLTEARESDLSELSQSPPYVLMVTNSHTHKNNLRACQAVARAREAGTEITIRVAGGLDPAATAFCRQAGVPLFVEPAVDGARLAALYRASALVLSPSLEEGHNLVIAEALASNARVLASDIPAHREFYPTGVAYFDPLDVSALAELLITTLNVDESARPAFRVNRTWQDVATDYVRLFSNL